MRVLLAAFAALLTLGAPPGPARAADTPGDIEIARAVESELMSQGLTIAHSLNVSARDGIVILSGSVDSLLDVARALEVVRATRGVRSVVSRVVVEPVERTDAEIARDTKRRLARDIATDDLELDVDVSDGVVRLGGSVQSTLQGRIAMRIAESVPGVRSVVDELAIDYGEPRRDAEVADDVRRRLRADVSVRHGLLEVEVRDGQVKVLGFVGSAAERERVYTDAFVRGVRSVDVSGLEVRPWAHDATKRRASEPPADAEIRAAIRDALVYDPRISATDIEVTVEDGVAYLRGTAETALGKREAREIARNTSGVLRARDLLKVRPARTPGTADLAQRVREALAAAPSLDPGSIEITQRRGRIYLDGWVDDAAERKRAIAAAEAVNGVLEVRSRLDVPRTRAPQTDEELARAIEEQLYWDAEVDETSVRVAVEDGVATLTGAVDGWRERERAEENAFEAGAVEVRNRLGVQMLAPEDARA